MDVDPQHPLHSKKEKKIGDTNHRGIPPLNFQSETYYPPPSKTSTPLVINSERSLIKI